MLISQNGHERLSDYRLMPAQANHAFMVAATPGVVGISGWLAPELINPPCWKGHRARQLADMKWADILAFAMSGIEVFTGDLPFGDVKHETAILMVAQGKGPEIPLGPESRGFTTDIWKITQGCWQRNPTKRLDIEAVVYACHNFCFRELFLQLCVASESNRIPPDVGQACLVPPCHNRPKTPIPPPPPGQRSSILTIDHMSIVGASPQESCTCLKHITIDGGNLLVVQSPPGTPGLTVGINKNTLDGAEMS